MGNNHWLVATVRDNGTKYTIGVLDVIVHISDLNEQHLHIAHVQHYYVRVDIDWPNHMFLMSFDWKHYVHNVSNHHHVSLRNRFIILIDRLIDWEFEFVVAHAVWWVWAHNLRMHFRIMLNRWWRANRYQLPSDAIFIAFDIASTVWEDSQWIIILNVHLCQWN